jgi:hypothetical protein
MLLDMLTMDMLLESRQFCTNPREGARECTAAEAPTDPKWSYYSVGLVLELNILYTRCGLVLWRAEIHFAERQARETYSYSTSSLLPPLPL